jgi:hypothetical protein
LEAISITAYTSDGCTRIDKESDCEVLSATNIDDLLCSAKYRPTRFHHWWLRELVKNTHGRILIDKNHSIGDRKAFISIVSHTVPENGSNVAVIGIHGWLEVAADNAFTS